MRDLLILAVHLLVTIAKLLRPGGGRAVAAESLLLIHQLQIVNRSRQRAPNLTTLDRFVLGLTTLFIRPHRIPKVAAMLKPATLLKFHKALVYRKHRPDNSDSHGQSWLSFLAQTKDSLWSLDIFRCESIQLRSHWVMLVMDVFTRRIIGFGVERANIDGVSVCRMFNYATAGEPMPARISTDHDPLFPTAGSPTYACSKSRRSSPSHTPRCRTLSWND